MADLRNLETAVPQVCGYPVIKRHEATLLRLWSGDEFVRCRLRRVR